jgi:3D (Asp-Asp-Asp) domain-containing protein
MIIARSFWRKATATTIAAAAFACLYEVTILDSQHAAVQTALHETTALPSPGARLAFAATAYCKGITTASGVAAQRGVAAADPELLPVGSVIQIDSPEARYNGIYTVMDTGPLIQGRHIDLYMWDCNEALTFGRRSIRLTVLRLGWNPRATTPTFLNRLFRKPEKTEQPILPSRPLPQSQSLSDTAR